MYVRGPQPPSILKWGGEIPPHLPGSTPMRAIHLEALENETFPMD